MEGLTNVIHETKKDLYPNSVSEVNKFLDDYRSIFAKGENDLRKISIVQHCIYIGDAAPIRQRPRKVPFVKEAEIKRQLEEMLKPGIIEPSSIPLASLHGFPEGE